MNEKLSEVLLCLICDNEFTKKLYNKVYCSEKCRKRAECYRYRRRHGQKKIIEYPNDED